jgi:hypothetical protein
LSTVLTVLDSTVLTVLDSTVLTVLDSTVLTVLDSTHRLIRGFHVGKGKGKKFQLQAWTGPEDSRRLRVPDFKSFGT